MSNHYDRLRDQVFRPILEAYDTTPAILDHPDMLALVKRLNLENIDLPETRAEIARTTQKIVDDQRARRDRLEAWFGRKIAT